MKRDHWQSGWMVLILSLVMCGLVPATGWGAGPVIVPPPTPDPHYTKIGFFDIRICHWPDRPPFMQVLFSTTQYDVVRDVEVLSPDGKRVTRVVFDKYRLIKQKDGSEKRIYITPFPLTPDAQGGWYTGRITTADGTVYLARDQVEIKTLPIARNQKPVTDSENISLPSHLSWDPVPGAKAYQVFVHDIWEGEILIYHSPHLKESRVKLPEGLLKPGGYYMWRVHSRNVDEDVNFGDFNHGSLTPFSRFSVK